LYDHRRGNAALSRRSSRQNRGLKAIFRTDHLSVLPHLPWQGFITFYGCLKIRCAGHTVA
jgi:hypothetical protein